eukprot:312873-Hanusia_phi.AAC.6
MYLSLSIKIRSILNACVPTHLSNEQEVHQATSIDLSHAAKALPRVCFCQFPTRQPMSEGKSNEPVRPINLLRRMSRQLISRLWSTLAFPRLALNFDHSNENSRRPPARASPAECGCARSLSSCSTLCTSSQCTLPYSFPQQTHLNAPSLSFTLSSASLSLRRKQMSRRESFSEPTTKACSPRAQVAVHVAATANKSERIVLHVQVLHLNCWDGAEASPRLRCSSCA